MTHNSKNDFHYLSSKFLFILNNIDRGEYDSENINFLLNELNSIDYKTDQSFNQTDVDTILREIYKIPSNEETLVVKSCCLITSLVQYLKIKLEENFLNKLIDWLLKALYKNYKSIVCDIFGTLKVLIKGNSEKISKFYDTLLGYDGILLISLLNNNLNKKEIYESNSSVDITLSSILCLESFFKYTEDNLDIKIPLEYVTNIGNRILNLVYTSKLESYGESRYCNLITSSLNITRSIAWIDNIWAEEKLEELLGFAQAFLLYQLPNFICLMPKKVVASQRSLIEPNMQMGKEKNKIKQKSRKPRKFCGPINEKNQKSDNINLIVENTVNYENNLEQEFTSFSNNLFFKTSDSDYSESESSRIQHERKTQAKLRQSALMLIGILAKKTSKQILFGYWHTFFPSTLTENTNCLINSVLKDSSPNCRITALQTMSFIFYKSKPYLIQADLSEKSPSSFTPFSITLGNMLISIFNNLTTALSNEGSLLVMIQLLKCLNIFIQEVTFKNFPRILHKNIMKQTRQLIYHKDVDIQVTSLVVIEAILESMDTLDEISDILEDISIKNQIKDDIECISDDEEEEIIVDDLENETKSISNLDLEDKTEKPKVSWLIQRILENLGINVLNVNIYYPTSTPKIRIESLQLLSVMASHYILLKDYIHSITLALEKCFKDKNPQIQTSAGKCLKALGNGSNIYFSKQDKLKDDNIDLNQCLGLYIKILPYTMEIIQTSGQQTNRSKSAKLITFEALACIGVNIFERLPNKDRITLITFLSGNDFDGDIECKIAAIRTLGVYVLFPSLKTDICFIENTSEIILNLLNQKEDSIQSTASWALGNTLNAFDSDESLEMINDNLLERLIKICMKVSDLTSQPSTQCNIMRSLGCLLKLLNKAHLEQSNWIDMFLEGVNKMVKNGLNKGQMKPRWNTCYALALVLKNPFIYDLKLCAQWQQIVFPNLCNTIKTCVNFKVRTNAASALSVPSKRFAYGNHFMNIWTSILIALEHCDDLVDFSEYKHRDDLINQLCFSISHLIKLMEKVDIISMSNQLVGRSDVIQMHWNRVINRVIPDKATPLIEATLKLQSYKKPDINAEQYSSLETLKSCFTPINEYI